MRSRYSAFCTGNSAHLLRTWHPRTVPDALGDLAPDDWYGLEVVDVVDGAEGDRTGVVEFVAHHAGGDLHERSRFEFRGGRWLYLDDRG